MWQGLTLCGLLSLGGYALAYMPFIAGSGFSPLVLALLLGLLMGNMPVIHTLTPLAQPGIAFASRRLLRIGIVLLGFQITVQQIIQLGLIVLLLDMGVIVVVMCAGYWIGTRWLKLDKELTLLTCSGSAICGAAAVLATETTIQARSVNVSMAVATVVLFGTASMLIYPLIYPVSQMNDGVFGIYIGATVHEVAQVVAASSAISEQALFNGVVVKLIRVILLVPFLFILQQWWIRHQSNDYEKQTITVPWFAFGFLGIVFINSLVQFSGVQSYLVLVSQICLVMAMAALGFSTRIDKLMALGTKPFLLALGLFLMLLIGGFISVHLLSPFLI